MQQAQWPGRNVHDENIIFLMQPNFSTNEQIKKKARHVSYVACLCVMYLYDGDDDDDDASVLLFEMQKMSTECTERTDGTLT